MKLFSSKMLFRWAVFFIAGFALVSPSSGVVAQTTTSSGYVSPTAQGGGLVPCGTVANPRPCTLCHLVIGVHDVIQWGMTVMTFFAIAILVAMAIVYVVSAGNDGMMKTAKGGIKATLVGFVVILGGWVIINFVMLTLTKQDLGIGAVNWYTFTCETTSSTGTTGLPGTPSTPGTTGPLPVGCSNYSSQFQQAAQATGVDQCLLEGVAAAESSCNPNAVAADGLSCGLMQVRMTTSGQTCDQLKSDTAGNIMMAANILKQNQSALGAYNGTFEVGNQFTQTGTTFQINGEGKTYDSGNDDLIASYNGGTGNGTNSDGTRQPFAVSNDCPGGVPAWQCPVNPGGFGQTQTYVSNVQSYQKQCGAK